MENNKSDKDEEIIKYDGAGNEIHIINGPLGKMAIKKLSAICGCLPVNNIATNIIAK